MLRANFFLSIISLAILFVGFGSCSKDDDPEVCTLSRVEEKASYPPGASESGYTRVTLYEFSGSVLSHLSAYEEDVPDDVQNLKLSYDSQNRLVGAEDAVSTLEIDFIYDSDGNVTELKESLFGTLRHRSLYEYNGAGQLVKVSYFSLGSSGMQLALSVVCEYPDTKTNNFSTKKYFDKLESEPFGIMEYAWDSKKSPYENLPTFLVLDKGDNNIVKVTTTYAGVPLTDVKEYVYEYNERGYPTSRTYTRNAPSEFTEQITFEYNCKK